MSNRVQAKNTPDKQTNRCRNQQPLRKQFRVHKGQLFIASDLGLLLKERCGQDKGGQCSVVQGRQDPRRVINLGRLYLPWGPMPPARFPGKGVGAVTRELGTEPRWQHIPLGGLYSVPDRTAPERSRCWVISLNSWEWGSGPRRRGWRTEGGAGVSVLGIRILTPSKLTGYYFGWWVLHNLEKAVDPFRASVGMQQG